MAVIVEAVQFVVRFVVPEEFKIYNYRELFGENYSDQLSNFVYNPNIFRVKTSNWYMKRKSHWKLKQFNNRLLKPKELWIKIELKRSFNLTLQQWNFTTNIFPFFIFSLLLLINKLNKKAINIKNLFCSYYSQILHLFAGDILGLDSFFSCDRLLVSRVKKDGTFFCFFLFSHWISNISISFWGYFSILNKILHILSNFYKSLQFITNNYSSL